jgi:hypothetical protein
MTARRFTGRGQGPLRLLGYPHFYPQPGESGNYEDNRIFDAILGCFWGPVMTIAEPLASVEDNSLEAQIARNIPKVPRTAAFRRTESGDGEPSTESLGNRMRQISILSMGEIDSLISELQMLREKLQTDGERIERDIAKYTELNQQVMRLTTIISDSVKKLPGVSGTVR